MMTTNSSQQESISALADGELNDVQLDAILASLNTAKGKGTWEIYHQIGDALRSDDLGISFSANFSRRFSARLDAEPVILAPHSVDKKPSRSATKLQSYWGSYMAVAGVAAAAVFAVVLAPQLAHLGGDTTPAIQLSKSRQADANMQLASASGTSEMQNAAVNRIGKKDEKQINLPLNEMPDMLRDPRIDSYLMAHQRFSPALSNGTQLVTRANAVSSASEK
ncbi:MAG: sigma-E factor negative regulatory protein [Burkholderiales bacterium]|nr:sigma-E factor negative regulatory protein [Burkholderiales bacterium]